MQSNKRTAYPIMAVSSFPVQPEPIIDNASETVTYYGYAPLGAQEDEDAWLVVRKTTNGGVIKTEYANGQLDFNQKWSERASLTYSR